MKNHNLNQYNPPSSSFKRLYISIQNKELSQIAFIILTIYITRAVSLLKARYVQYLYLQAPYAPTNEGYKVTSRQIMTRFNVNDFGPRQVSFTFRPRFAKLWNGIVIKMIKKGIIIVNKILIIIQKVLSLFKSLFSVSTQRFQYMLSHVYMYLRGGCEHKIKIREHC